MVLAVLALGGCTVARTPIGVLAADSQAVSVKVLRPGTSARACRSSILGLSLGAPEPSLRVALAELFALDAEANVLTDAEVTWEAFTTGVYNRSCIVVWGDLGRTVRTIALPALGGHEGHGTR